MRSLLLHIVRSDFPGTNVADLQAIYPVTKSPIGDRHKRIWTQRKEYWTTLVYEWLHESSCISLQALSLSSTMYLMVKKDGFFVFFDRIFIIFDFTFPTKQYG